MKILRNRRGFALATALLLTLVTLAITTALLTLITAGIRMTAGQKRYRNALAAAYGGVEITSRDVIPNIMGKVLRGESIAAFDTSYTLVNLTLQGANPIACLQDKLSLPTDQWTSCGANAATPVASVEPDFTFTLRGFNAASAFTMKVKIVDTIPGNSDPSDTELLDPGLAVAGSVPGISPSHIPALLTLEVEGTQGANPREKADLSVLYAY